MIRPKGYGWIEIAIRQNVEQYKPGHNTHPGRLGEWLGIPRLGQHFVSDP
jgi:hypothetical protein